MTCQVCNRPTPIGTRCQRHIVYTYGVPLLSLSDLAEIVRMIEAKETQKKSA